MTSQPVNTYDRQWDEPEEAWAAFYRYRDINTPRARLEDFGMVSGFSVGQLKNWSKRFDWPARLVAWDQRVDGARQSTTLRGVEEMASRHIGLAKEGLEILQMAFKKIRKDLETDFGRMKPHEMMRFLEVCAKLERLSRGEATERIDGEGTDYSQLTNQDLQALEDISKRIH